LTTLTQAESSTYALAEVNVGGKIGRHDLGIEQLGPRTVTELSCFNLAGAGQCMDLHSSVTLDHEEGKTDQVHKCIVSSASGRGVFDGNVKVNKLAQRTDAGQISRNLLLVPKATVNVKPNLQIVADDVVCTHGCTVSDLEEEELFYIQSRGLSPAVARSLLVAGFGLEIVSKLPGGKDIRDRVGALVKASLDKDDVQLVA
jgi:Fe-S cluster assembly protein SufD